MKINRKKKELDKEYENLDKIAHDISDIRPLTPAMRSDWEAAKRTGTKMRRGRPRKDAELKSRIVPISIEPSLLAEIDRYAKSEGLSRSRLVAEGLRLRMQG